eukprot:gene896-1405_t
MKSIDPVFLDDHDEGVNATWNADNFTGWCFGYIRSTKDGLFDADLSELNMSESVLHVRGTNEGVDYQDVKPEYPTRMHDMCVRFDSSVTVKTGNNITDSGSDLHGEVIFSNGAVLHLTRGSPIITMELPVGVMAKITPLFYDLILAPPSHYESGRNSQPEAACDALANGDEPYADNVVMWSDTNTSYYHDSPATSYKYGYLLQHFSSDHEIVCSPTVQEYEQNHYDDNVTDATCVVKTNSGLDKSMKKACCNCCPTQCYATVQANGTKPALLRFAFYTDPSSARTLLSYSDYYVAGAEVLIEEQSNNLVYEYKTKPTSDPTQEAVVDESRQVLLGAMHHHVNSWTEEEFSEISVYNHNRSFECYSDPAFPRTCKDVMRHVGDDTYVRGAHDGRLQYTTATVWHMNVTDPEVPDPNATILALSEVQKGVICDIFESEEHEFNSRDPTLYFLGKYTYRMSRVLFVAEILQCGNGTKREALRSRVHHGLMRFLDGKYPYYTEHGGNGTGTCFETGQCADYCEEGCVHQSGLRYDDNGWGGIIIDGNYGDSRNNTQYNDCGYDCSLNNVINYDKSEDYGHKHYNDHHYHFGYMIASIALYANSHSDFFEEIPTSPACPGATGANCPTVKDKTLTLVKEVANHDHTDPYFPQARHKDMYDWASWAGAIEEHDDGLRDQEATVEGYVAYYGAELIAKLLNDQELILWTRLLRGTDQHGWNSYRWFLPEVGHAPQERFGGVSSYSEIGLQVQLQELKWSSALFWECEPDCFPHRFACWIAINVLPLIPGVTEKHYDSDWAGYVKNNLGDPALEANTCIINNVATASEKLAQPWRNYVHAFHALTRQNVSSHREAFTTEAVSSNTTMLDNGMSRIDTLVWFYNIENSVLR